MIYSDGIHIVSNVSVVDLHEQCMKIGIKRCWFHSGSDFPHYDLPKRLRHDLEFLKKNNVPFITPREVLEILKESKQVKYALPNARTNP